MSDKKPMVLVLAEPNGSGKSTITQFFDIVGAYTNADDMVAATGMSNEETAVRADEMRYRSLDNIKDLMTICDILHVYDNTEEPVRIIRKHKEQISVFPNELWTTERILSLL